MFIIRFRITDDISQIKARSAREFDEEGDLEGFFELEFEGNSYGYFHDRPLKEGETGFDLIDRWIEDLLRAVLLLENSAYVAISDIETLYVWLEIERCEERLKVSLIRNDIIEVEESIIDRPFPERNYLDWKNIWITFSEFRNEVIQKAELYLESLVEINPNLNESRRVIRKKELLELIKEE